MRIRCTQYGCLSADVKRVDRRTGVQTVACNSIVVGMLLTIKLDVIYMKEDIWNKMGRMAETERFVEDLLK